MWKTHYEKVRLVVTGLLAIVFLCCFSPQAYAVQIPIERVEQMPNIPQPFQMRNWREVAEKFDKVAFDFDAKGEYFPLIAWDRNRQNFNLDTFFMPTYVGDYRAIPGQQESVVSLGAVLGSTIAGIDKSNQDGHNWVLMTKQYFNRLTGEDLVLNHAIMHSGGSFWYEVFPHIIFYSLVEKYPDTATIRTPTTTVEQDELSMEDIMYITARKWYEASYHMGGNTGSPDFNWTAFNFRAMEPVYNGLYREPDAAAGIAWLQYMAYLKFKEEDFLTGADWGMQYLDGINYGLSEPDMKYGVIRKGFLYDEYDYNPFYENLLPYGVYVAARMNAELGREYDVDKFINWVFGPADARDDWGVIAQTWGDYDVHGLVGHLVGWGGYTAIMASYTVPGALVPIPRYDPRYARAIGKWMLNLANNARLYYSGYVPDEHQSFPGWDGDPDNVFPYEGIRRWKDDITPYVLGDPLRMGWANIHTDFAVYGGAFVGVLGGLISPTNDEKILQLDLLVTDFLHDRAYPTFLYYNPYDEERSVQIDVGPQEKDLYDAATKRFLRTSVTGLTEFSIAADSAVVIVVAPANGIVSYDGNKMLIDDVIVDYSRGSLRIVSPIKGKTVFDGYPIAVEATISDSLILERVVVEFGGEEVYVGTTIPESILLDTTKYANGVSDTLTVVAKTEDGAILKDAVRVSVNNSVVFYAEAKDIAVWESFEASPGTVAFEKNMAVIAETNLRGDWGGVVSKPIAVELSRRPMITVGSVRPDYTWMLMIRTDDVENNRLRNSGIVVAQDTQMFGTVSVDIVEGIRNSQSWALSYLDLDRVYNIELIVLATGEEGATVSLSDIGIFYRDVDPEI